MGFSFKIYSVRSEEMSPMVTVDIVHANSNGFDLILCMEDGTVTPNRLCHCCFWYPVTSIQNARCSFVESKIAFMISFDLDRLDLHGKID